MRRSILAAFAIVAFLLGGGALAAEKQLRWTSSFPINVIDPYYNTDREPIIVNGQLVWDTLVYRDPATGKYLPQLAESWRWRDDKTLEFKLRPGVLWHDGKPLTADDAVYTLNYVSGPNAKIPVQQNVNWIAGAEKVDERTFLLRLKAPFPAAFEYLSGVIAILPVDFFGTTGTAGANGRLVGTGPYKIKSFTPGATVELERFDKYFNGPKGAPKFDRISFRFMPEKTTQIAELMGGGVDWIWQVPKDQAERLAKVPSLKVTEGETMRWSYLAFNVRDMPGGNPVKDIRVRQAIAHAIDRPALVKNMVGSGSKVANVPCYHTQFGCPQPKQVWDYDPAKSKRLLAEAGYASGLKLDIVAWRSREWTEAIVGYLNAVGIQTNVHFGQYTAARQKINDNTTHLVLGDWGSYSINDTSAALNYFFTLTADDLAGDKEVASWLGAAASTNDEAKRKEDYSKAVTRIVDRLYMLPLWSHPVIYAYKKDLAFQSYPDENPRFFLVK